TTAEDLKAQSQDPTWDVIFLALTFPQTIEDGFATYTRLLDELPGVPLVAACRPSEMISLPRFLTHGLRFYIYRDPQADYIFLVLTTLESAVKAIHADEARKLAE